MTAVPMFFLYLVVSVKMLDSRYGHVFTLPLIFGFLKDDFLLSALIPVCVDVYKG